jgi:hypothetical protein
MIPLVMLTLIVWGAVTAKTPAVSGWLAVAAVGYVWFWYIGAMG